MGHYPRKIDEHFLSPVRYWYHNEMELFEAFWNLIFKTDFFLRNSFCELRETRKALFPPTNFSFHPFPNFPSAVSKFTNYLMCGCGPKIVRDFHQKSVGFDCDCGHAQHLWEQTFLKHHACVAIYVWCLSMHIL